jgi:peptidyl-prolyl cis-trans isomerase B (cyclophilin B)
VPTNKQRRDAERRRLQRQSQRRRQRHAARKRVTLLISIVGALAVIAIVVGVVIATNHDSKTPAAGSGSVASSAPTVPASTSATTPRVPGSCTFTRTGTAARRVALPAARAPITGTTDVALNTTQGAMTFALDRAAAPCTVASFVSLVQQHYFDKTICHRLTTSGIYVLQCGDPTGTGRGGPGYAFADELTGKEKYTRGVLAMANSGPNTNGSQFFIVYRDSTLGPQYTVFGTVKTGLSVVDKVAAKGAASGADGAPKLPITITRATVAK